MSLKSYLQQHFVDKPTFSSMVGISTARLDELIAIQAIPAATYVCDQKTVRSAAFGVMEAPESLAGEFFRPQCARWARIAATAPHGMEREAVEAVLVGELRMALRECCAIPNEADIDAKIQCYLPHFWNGTFGLCVADPASGGGIVRKEVLQERLTALTANGSRSAPDGISSSELLGLIDDYARSAMPFSPVEYERSSRKRLVDDLRSRIIKEQAEVQAGNCGRRRNEGTQQ